MLRIAKHCLVVFSVVVLGWVVYATDIGFSFEQNSGLRWLFLMRGPLETPSNVAVISIDDQTGTNLGISRLPRDWPRSIHAKLVDNLTRFGASVIVFDFDFQIPKKAEDDLAFANAIKASNRVVLAEKLVNKRQALQDSSGGQKGFVRLEQALPPIPILADGARTTAPFPLPKIEAAVHEFWTFKPSLGGVPTMPAAALQLYVESRLSALHTAGSGQEQQDLVFADALKKGSNLRTEMMRKHKAMAEQSTTPETPSHEPAIPSSAVPLDIQAALENLYLGYDQRLLNFYGPPGTIQTIPYHQIINPGESGETPNPPNLTGKVVFVGYSDIYDPEQPDRFYTVYTNDEGVDLSGVEIAATSFSNLLSGTDINAPTTLTALGMIGVIGVVFGGIAYSVTAVIGIPLVLVLGASYMYWVFQSFDHHHYWLPFTTPLLFQLPAALFIGLFVHYARERERKRRAAEAVKMYIPEHLADGYIDKGFEPSTLNKVTYSVCLASDMAGFTTIGEQLPPGELAVFLNDYFESLSAPLRANHVDVVEYRADGVMCAWTGSASDTAIHRNSIHAAIEAVEAIALFKQRHNLLKQSLRIGLECGNTFIGHAGGGGHFVYSIVGDCANTAARVEGLNKFLSTQVLATEAIVKDLPGIVTRYIGHFMFVGKKETLPVYEVLAKTDVVDAQVATLCRDFDQAIATLKQGDWQGALIRFEQILLKYPEDGPTQFHYKRCSEQLSRGEPDAGDPCVIRMDQK